MIVFGSAVVVLANGSIADPNARARVLDEIRQNPSKAQEILAETLSRNQSVFEFEKALAN